jgi:antitoxin ParD1/3/4
MQDMPHEHRMVGMNVSLPETLRAYVQSRLADGFGSVSEYVRQLIRQDQQAIARARTEAVLAGGLSNGEFDAGLVDQALTALQALRSELAARGVSVTQAEIRSAIDEGRR